MKKNEKFKIIENNVQKEALTNEVKGNLFEYLVSNLVARHFCVESNFIKSADKQLHETLRYYEGWLRKNQPELLKKLPLLAKNLSDSIISYLESRDIGKVLNVVVLGKIAAGSHNHKFAEADMLILTDKLQIPFSLKLSKAHAFLNTKSAGVKSFFTRYFSMFESAQFKQSTFNQIIDKGFIRFGRELYDRRGLDFQDRFDHMWKWSELPSSLKDDDRISFDEFLQETLFNLHKNILEFYHEDKELFKKSLFSLMGYSDLSVVQACLFHTQNKSENYLYHSDFVHDCNSYQDIKIDQLDGIKSSFNILLDGDALQIRLKPMNKFTTASYKVNCSVKYQK